MQRKWITVEAGSQCRTHIRERLVRVVDGTDRTGISRALGATEGGAFLYVTVNSESS
jgi:adenine-specific DNA-methyltransferase